MHKERVKYWDSKTKKYKYTTIKTYDTKVHATHGKAHALKDIEKLVAEEAKEKHRKKTVKKRINK